MLKVTCKRRGEVRESFCQDALNPSALQGEHAQQHNLLFSSTSMLLVSQAMHIPISVQQKHPLELDGACTFDPHPSPLLRALEGGTGQAGEASWVPNALPSPHPRSHLCGGSLLEREDRLPLLRTPLLHFLGVAHDGVHIAVSIKAGVEVKAQVGRVLPQIHHKAAGKGDRHHSSTSLITMTASGPAPSSPEEGVQGEIP